MLNKYAHKFMSLNKIMSKLPKKQKYLLAFLLGIFSTLAMPPISFWPILFITFPVLIWLVDGTVFAENKAPTESKIKFNKSQLKQIGIICWAFGFGYLLVSLYWLGSSFLVEPEKFGWVLPFAVTLLPAFLGLFYSIPLILGSLFWTTGPERLIIFSLSIFCADWLRSHILTGFPWNLIGHSLTGQLEFMQSISVFGLFGLSAIAALIFSTPALLASPLDDAKKTAEIQTHFSISKILPLAFSALVLIGMYGFGVLRIASEGPTKFLKEYELVLVQPNISQKDKVDLKKRPGALLKTIELTETLPELDKNKFEHRLIIWPETAIPFALNRSPTILKRLDEMLAERSTLISGAFHVENNQDLNSTSNYQVYNSLFVVNDRGEIESLYDKNHLVPFGEYLPFPQLFRWLGLKAIADERGGFKIGPEPKPLQLTKAPSFLPSICYEAIFPLPENTAQQGAKWLLNISNDGWFGQTVGPHQHLHQVRLRALETGLPMVRSVNGGMSAIFDGIGRVVKKTSLNKTEIVISKLPKTSKIINLPLPKELLSFLVLLTFGVLISTEKILTNRSKFTSKH